MIKALIVDDEPLVRKGLNFLLPWDKYGIKVVGEASNGRKALEYIQGNKVDVVFTDISMPEMDGLALLKDISRDYRDISVVVLTCYEEFNYVQEALRFGAIDYILKTQLENDKVDEVLASITKRLHSIQPKERWLQFECGMVLISIEQKENKEIEEWLKLHPNLPVADNVWFIPTESDEEEFQESSIVYNYHGLVGVKVSDLKGFTWEDIYKMLNQYLDYHFFYEYQPNKKLYDCKISNLPDNRSFDLNELVIKWSSYEWMFRDECFHVLQATVEQFRPYPAKVKQIFYESMFKWAEEFDIGNCIHEWLSKFENFSSWHDWKMWLLDVRQVIRERYNNSQYPEEIVAGIYKAINYMRKQENLHFTQEEIAEYACMSRAYFSRYFKRIAGTSFTEFVKQLRIEKAQHLLSTTMLPIYEIAEQTGFKDERYFSKVFQMEVKCLPSAYRKKVKFQENSQNGIK
ncbi:response regulator transcription factor [Gracilibacillus sp. HCP3S3_G5_1]|uniref:response regulator transcription factor n=1 Tax=unclassified Gracilibacillus TaxID=2625209 RepID=UPI003F8C1400